MDDLWTRLESWLSSNAPELVDQLRPGADADALASLEHELGVTLPDDVRASLAVHDGTEESAGLVGGWDLLPVEIIASEARLMRGMVEDGAFGEATANAHPKLAGPWWNPAWLPIVSSGSGHFLCVDLAPGPEGRVGQVVLFLHDAPERYVVAPSYRAWLEAVVRDLESGAYTREDGEWNAHAFMRSSEEGKDLYG